MRDWRKWIVGIPLVCLALIIIVPVCIMGKWDFVWSMSGSYEDGMQSIRMQECVFDKDLYEDYKLIFDIGVLEGGTSQLRFLDSEGNVIKEWEPVSRTFEERLDDKVIERLCAAEVVSEGPEDCLVGYTVRLEGRKNIWKALKKRFQKGNFI